MLFSESLKKNEDFQKVYKQGTSHAGRYLVMYVLKQDDQKNKLGISVSKKVGNSVVRHRLKRLVRESYRLNEKFFEKGYHIVVVVRASAKEQGFHEISRAFLNLADMHGILKKDEKNSDMAY